jgi:hypothetical protein
MSDNRANLAVSLHRAATDLSEVATALPGLRTDQEIEHQAQVLDHIAEEASDGASILRALIARWQRERAAQPAASVPCDPASHNQADGGS